MANDEVSQRVQLALSQSKRVAKDARILTQMLAGLRDNLQPEGQKENQDDRPKN